MEKKRTMTYLLIIAQHYIWTNNFSGYVLCVYEIRKLITYNGYGNNLNVTMLAECLVTIPILYYDLIEIELTALK